MLKQARFEGVEKLAVFRVVGGPDDGQIVRAKCDSADDAYDVAKLAQRPIGDDRKAEAAQKLADAIGKFLAVGGEDARRLEAAVLVADLAIQFADEDHPY